MSTARTRLAPLAPVIDAVCIAVFVLLGRESHGLDAGASWFLIVVWPFLAGWFAMALALRLYTSRSHPGWRLVATALAGVAIAQALRAVVTHRDTPVAFIVVAYVFICLATFGWRIAASAVVALASRR